ncbi:cupin domain-containing protein [Spirulina subsalsa]|uniref:cupin domain-containing protein n=1 Tax=Spirulina subsalsa TaxID=54311 RepID=UPI0002FCF740|nr:cupin domain-containing protein [Spirulina subsalsa]
MTEILANLITPLTVETFVGEIWTQKAVYLPALHPQRFQELFAWEDLNHLLNFHPLNNPDLRFHQGGQSWPDVPVKQGRDSRTETLRHRLKQGATLILNQVHQRHPPLAQWTAALQRDLGHPVQVNLYLSPPHQQGFNCHYDTHEVFILQLDGEKEWLIYDPTVAYPTSETRQDSDLPPETPPYWQGVLKPGDVLYIPRGHWHYAIALEQYSLHLTVGVSSPTGLDWLEWAIAQLQKQPQWRQNLPLLHLDSQSLEQSLHHLGTALTQWITSDQTLQAYRQHLQHQQPPLPLQLPQQLHPTLDPSEWSLDTHFQPSPLHRPQILGSEAEGWEIDFANRHITLQGLSPAALACLFNPQGFTLSELAETAPTLSLDDALKIIARLVQEGVLSINSQFSH